MKQERRSLADSVHDRLRSHARKRGVEVLLVQQQYAAGRLLFRLTQSPHRDRFVLRGAMLYVLWGGEAYRPTGDLDLFCYGSAELDQVAAFFHDAFAVNVPDDGLELRPGGIEVVKVGEKADYDGVKAKLEIDLKPTCIPLSVDIAFGDVLVPNPEIVTYPALLDGPAVRIPAYTRECVVAEKLRAAIFTCHLFLWFGDANTRMQDFYDLFVFSHAFAFDGATLAQAIATTFERCRTTVDPPLPLPLTFFDEEVLADKWRGYLEQNRLAGAPSDFTAVGQALHAFLGPPYDALATTDDFQAAWRPGGPWQ